MGLQAKLTDTDRNTQNKELLKQTVLADVVATDATLIEALYKHAFPNRTRRNAANAAE
jgi:hypothetical protein